MQATLTPLKPGDACASHSECRAAGDETAICDLSARKCIGKCNSDPTAKYLGSADDDAIRFCTEFPNEVALEMKAPCPTHPLPRLSRVGTLRLIAREGTPDEFKDASCGEISFDSLETALSIWISHVGSPSISFPRLTAAEVTLVDQALRSFSAPELRTSARIWLETMPEFTQLSLPRLREVGMARFYELCALPLPQLSAIMTLAPDAMPNRYAVIGCCAADSSQHYGCEPNTCVCK
jgi:hypothetical protein